MRYLVVGLVLGVGIATASADPPAENGSHWKPQNDSGTFLDVGGGWMRANRDGVTYRAQYLRIATQVSLHHWFYVGAALQFGRIYGSSGMLNGMLPAQCTGRPGTCTGPGNNLHDESTGTIVEPQVVAGVRELVGIVSGGFEVAPTARWTTASASFLNQTFTTTVTTVELHARIDLWATPHLTAGVMVGTDYNTVHNLEAGLQIAFHFEPYDAMTYRGPFGP
ncbi:MAG: hypothetical protein ABI591_30795 [Kofleriaceae bacterium]